jgi:hypothetical protein
LSLLTRGRENARSTPSSSNRSFSVAARNSARSFRLGVAVIGMQDQWLLTALADALADAGPAHQIGCDGRVFLLGDIPGHHLAALDVDHQVEVQPHPSHGGGQFGDVPAPHLIGA